MNQEKEPNHMQLLEVTLIYRNIHGHYYIDRKQ